MSDITLLVALAAGGLVGLLFGLIPLVASIIVYYVYEKNYTVLGVGVVFFFVSIIGGFVLGMLCACPVATIGLISVLGAAYYFKTKQEKELDKKTPSKKEAGDESKN